jgi:hypothetical protein
MEDANHHLTNYFRLCPLLTRWFKLFSTSISTKRWCTGAIFTILFFCLHETYGIFPLKHYTSRERYRNHYNEFCNK